MIHSVIIPTFGNAPLVDQCLTSFFKHHKGEPVEVIVVDDGASLFERGAERGSMQRVCTKHKVDLEYHGKNRGFAAAVNLGIKRSTGDIVTLVNNDIIFTQNILTHIGKAFEISSEIGIIGAKLLYPNGSIQHGGLHYDSTHQSFLDKFKNKTGAPPSRYCLAVTGALFSIRRELINKIGLLNESYFIACEDTEYCLRAWDAGYRVIFNNFISATHLEGHTRGNTPQTKKKKSPMWHVKEFESIKQFKKDLKNFPIGKFQKEIRALNGEPNKLEVGSGHNPHDGYLHVDVRAGLPSLDYVCDFSKDKLPFEDNQFEEVLANHVIEHISWRKLPFVLGEWHRVLEPGGKLVLRTPDLNFICGTYLGLLGKITPEYPPDEKFIKENLSSEITPAWWANLKLFSGQDYEANFHRVCFDFDMLSDLLKRCGFGNVVRVQLDREFSPGELQVEAIKGRSRKLVLVKRKGALGDVLLTTPIIKRLHKEGYDVHVATDCPEVFENNPFVKAAHFFLQNHDRTIDLNLAYEKTPKMHIIDAYSMVAFGDTNTPHHLRTYFDLDDKEGVKPVTVHAGVSWENRTWPEKNWNDLSDKLIREYGAPVNWIGSKKTKSLKETAQLIYDSKLFIGSDSGLLHLAQALGVPSIGLYTCAKAEYRATLEYHHFPIIPDIDCYGCLHDEVPPVTYCGCRRGDLKCLDLITPEMVMEKVREVLGV